MRYGIVGGPLRAGLPYGLEVQRACDALAFSPTLAYAIKQNETGPTDLADVLQVGGNGHGIFQLDSSYPSDWANAQANAFYAVRHFMIPAEGFWAALGFTGDDLIRLIAATFNEGLGNAIAAHARGNVDLFTTNNYGERALLNYRVLLAGSGA